MIDFIQQTWRTCATILARCLITGGQFDGTIFATPQRFAATVVVANVVGTFAVNAWREFLAFVDFGVTDQALVAHVTLAMVCVYLRTPNRSSAILAKRIEEWGIARHNV